MSRFVTGVSDFVKEECRTAMLHGDMNISRLVVYEQSIKESKMTRVRKDLKRGRYEDQGQPRFENRAPNLDLSSAPKVNHEGGGGSQIAKPTCSTCGKKHFGKCLSGTSGCYGCGKNDHKVRDCPNIVVKGRNAKQAPYNGPSVDGQVRNRFYRGPAPPIATKWLRIADLLHQWPRSGSASLRHRGLYCLEFNFLITCGNTSASRSCFSTKSANIKLKLDLFKKVQLNEG
uniref:Gag-pol polyprotein n=1 Tax=Solanum tuberosum TaxID=4113 RepID=M1DEF3_SOLTU